MHEAKTHLSRLVQRVENGEEFVISRAGRPVARLVGLPKASTSRSPGAWRGRVVVADDFDILPDEILDAFDGMQR